MFCAFPNPEKSRDSIFKNPGIGILDPAGAWWWGKGATFARKYRCQGLGFGSNEQNQMDKFNRHWCDGVFGENIDSLTVQQEHLGTKIHSLDCAPTPIPRDLPSEWDHQLHCTKALHIHKYMYFTAYYAYYALQCIAEEHLSDVLDEPC